MEKLIELLNEWFQERYKTNIRFDKFENYGGNDYWYFQSNDNEHFMYETDVWTKKYWFIKRLVENKKIDLEKVKINWLNYVNDELLENKILMLLSIQDEPIEFLISILK